MLIISYLHALFHQTLHRKLKIEQHEPDRCSKSLIVETRTPAKSVVINSDIIYITEFITSTYMRLYIQKQPDWYNDIIVWNRDDMDALFGL